MRILRLYLIFGGRPWYSARNALAICFSVAGFFDAVEIVCNWASYSSNRLTYSIGISIFGDAVEPGLFRAWSRVWVFVPFVHVYCEYSLHMNFVLTIDYGPLMQHNMIKCNRHLFIYWGLFAYNVEVIINNRTTKKQMIKTFWWIISANVFILFSFAGWCLGL